MRPLTGRKEINMEKNVSVRSARVSKDTRYKDTKLVSEDMAVRGIRVRVKKVFIKYLCLSAGQRAFDLKGA